MTEPVRAGTSEGDQSEPLLLIQTDQCEPWSQCRCTDPYCKEWDCSTVYVIGSGSGERGRNDVGT